MRYKNKSGRLWLLLAAITIMAAGFSMVTYAEEAIKTVSVTVTSSVEAEADEGTVSATSNSSKYRVVSCDFANSRGSWKAGETPKVNIRLEAEEGYYFNSINAGKATVKGAVYSSAKKETDNHSLILSVKLKGVKGTLGTVESAYWESTPLGKARWSKVENAPAYEVKLYCGDSMVYRVEKTSSTNYDFFSHMTTRGDYYFKVRAVAKTESEADYLKAGEWTESDNQEITKRDAEAAETRKSSGNGSSGGSSGSDSQGPGQGDGPGSQNPGWEQDRNGWWYRNADGTYPVNSWQLINDKWYLFDMGGYMLTGWQTKNGREYYLTTNGDMVTGWFQYNRVWYYLDPQVGKVSGGWLQQGDDWYYMNPDGSMAVGWIRYKDNWYYLDPDSGRMVKDRVVETYYINPDGIWIP